MNLHQPLSVLPGVGPKSAEKFKKLGIETLEDLLLYFPFRYEDFKTRNVLELEDGGKSRHLWSGSNTSQCPILWATNEIACVFRSNRETRSLRLIFSTNPI